MGEEFRHALLMDASGDKANAARIGKLKKTLQGKGFLVTYLPEAQKNGCPAYERFVRSLPAKGKSILYYCGDVDVVKNAKTKRNEYHFRLGGYRFLPPDGFPGHNSRTVTDDQLRAMPTMSDRYVDGRVARVLPTASLRQLVILDLQSINDRANPDNSFERLLNGGRFLGFKPTAGEETTVCLANKENAGAALADKLNAALSSGKDILQGLTVGSLVLGATEKPFRLEGQSAKVISPPAQLIAGKRAGDQWLDPHGICFLWCPPGSFTMGWNGEPDAQPKQTSITRGFWMSKYELTKHQGGLFGLSSKGGTANHPVQVSDGNRLVQRIRNQGRYMEHRDRGFAGWSYDLPTEAEWEYACRAGEVEHVPAPFEKLGQHANFADKSLYGIKGTHGEEEHLYAYRGADDGVGLGPAGVGSYQPNAWGFHDMLGNLAEFCADFYKGELDGGVDPLDLFLQSDRKIHQRSKVYRGGAWCTTPNLLHYAYRGFSVPRSSGFLGVRLVIRQGERRSRTVEELHAALKGN